jgi:hypothetical protein
MSESRKLPDRPSFDEVDLMPYSGGKSVPLEQFVANTEDWDQVHEEAFTWEGNVFGTIRLTFGKSRVLISLKGSMVLANHLFDHGEDIRFGYPVQDHFDNGKMSYTVHPEWSGVGVYFRPPGR